MTKRNSVSPMPSVAGARFKEGAAALDLLCDELGDIDTIEAGVVIDLLLSYRSIGEWQRMVDLIGHMNVALAHTVMVREQRAFALNRLGKSHKAKLILKEVLSDRGPSSETYGLLGRVNKDRWEKARNQGDCSTGPRHSQTGDCCLS